MDKLATLVAAGKGSGGTTMAIGRASRNNVLAGLFVLSACALVVVVVVVMSNLGDRWTAQATYIVRFSVLEGAEGLDPGAPVKLGGQRVGRVTAWQIKDNEVSQEPAFVDVTIQIPTRYRLYSDADVQLLKPLLGTGSSINIISFSGMAIVGLDYQGPPKRLYSGDMVRGRLGPPGFIGPAEYARLLMPLVTVVPLQIFALELASAKGFDVDQPRNLAKSVTVE